MSVRQTLRKYEQALERAPRIRPLSSDGWASRVPRESGVYAVWQSSVPIYVGETSSLRLRMADLARPVNHSFSKKVAGDLGIAENAHIELAKAMSSRYHLSYVEVDLGRKEIEEYLILRWRNTLINKPTKRLRKSAQYSWVRPCDPSVHRRGLAGNRSSAKARYHDDDPR